MNHPALRQHVMKKYEITDRSEATIHHPEREQIA
jgi:hypothetical protein